VTGDGFGFDQPPPDLDDVSDGAFTERPNDLGVLGESDFSRRRR
jgi:hypothetical protein